VSVRHATPTSHSGDYLFVAAFAPPIASKGEAFAYELKTHSRKGNVKYHLLSGPEGMTILENGKVSWDVPKDAAAGLREVRLRLQDASGREATHSFRIRVDEK
jgi:hypothetical protein